MGRSIPLLALLLSALFVPAGLAGQSTLERTTNLPGGWVGLPWQIDLVSNRTFGPFPVEGEASWTARSDLTVALGLPVRAGVGARLGTLSWTEGAGHEIDLFLRYPSFGREHGLPFDIGGEIAYNVTAGSVDTEIAVRAPLGGLELLGALRGMTSAYGGDGRYTAALGAVFMPMPEALPVALTADLGTFLDREEGEALPWSAGVSVGVPYTAYTASLFATNTVSPTLQGRSLGTPHTRFGLEVTVPLPLARVVGAAVPRERAGEAVDPEPPAAPAVRAEIHRYRYVPERIVVGRGAVVEWVNRDTVMHTVSAEDGSWSSGPIEPGERWRASFDEPGLYPYYCGPHPYMKAVVEVR